METDIDTKSIRRLVINCEAVPNVLATLEVVVPVSWVSCMSGLNLSR